VALVAAALAEAAPEGAGKMQLAVFSPQSAGMAFMEQRTIDVEACPIMDYFDSDINFCNQVVTNPDL
jgi:hypothetical protein